MKYSYYPGCSLESTSVEYDISTREVFKAFDLTLEEIPDWNCCGASSAHSESYLLSLALPARDLAKAEDIESTVVAPCPSCYQNLKRVKEYVEKSIENRDRINKALEGTGLKVEGKVAVKHPLDILINELGLEKLAEKIKVPLEGLRVVTYYGCMIIRPDGSYTFDDMENPMTMDRITLTLGASVLPFTRKTRCCGGPVMVNNEETALRLSYDILKEAKEADAQAIIVACPLCHLSLDAKQPLIEKKYGDKVNLPIIYFTQLIGLALGIPEERLGFDKLIIDASGITAKYKPKKKKSNKKKTTAKAKSITTH